MVDNNKHWWRILTIEVWKELLEDTKVDGSCSIEVINAIYRNNKPCPIVIEEVDFKINHPTQFNEGDVLSISRKFHKYDIIDEISIHKSSNSIIWKHTPSTHKTPCAFKFSLVGHKDTTQKVISIKNYLPGVTFDIPQMIKATPLKDVSRKNSKNEFWESIIQLSNSGSHEMRINYDDEKIELKSIKQKKDNAKDYANLNYHERPSGSFVLFDLDEESQFELLFDVLEEKIQRQYHLKNLKV